MVDLVVVSLGEGEGGTMEAVEIKVDLTCAVLATAPEDGWLVT